MKLTAHMFFRKYVPSYIMTFRMSFKKLYVEHSLARIFIISVSNREN